MITHSIYNLPKIYELDNTELASTKITISHQKKQLNRKLSACCNTVYRISHGTGASAGSIIGGTVKSAGCVLLAKHGLFSAPGIIIGAKSALCRWTRTWNHAGLSGIVVIGLAVALQLQRLCKQKTTSTQLHKRGTFTHS